MKFKNYRKYAIFFSIALAGLFIDQLSKLLVGIFLEFNVMTPIIPNFFYLTYVTNSGAAWSILSGQILFLIITSIIVSLALIYYIIYHTKTLFANISGAILLGGITGNLVDRIKYQAVTDFLDFKIFGYDFPIFNVADMLIFIGAFCLIFALQREDKLEDEEVKKFQKQMEDEDE